MGIVITNAPNPGRVGPGYLFFWQIGAGPIPNDDHVQIVVLDPASGTGNYLDLTDVSTRGLLTGRAIMGTNEFGQRSFGIDHYVAPGALVNLRVDQLHANGALVDRTTYNNWQWDPTGGLYVLAENAVTLSNPILAQILAAVTTTFPRTS